MIAKSKEEKSDYYLICSYFPEELKRMLAQTRILQEMDDLYKEGDFHYDYYTGERYLFVKGRKVSEMQFLQDYLRECKKYDLKPKKELKDRLAELTKPKDSYIPFCL